MKDQFGPEYSVRVTDPKIGLEAFLVIDNTALGPGKGGIRMTADVTEEEVRRLARAMTWKNALAGIPFGGAKAGIRWEPSSDKEHEKERKKGIIESFARAIRPLLLEKYIAGPDVHTGEEEMRWFAEAAGNWNMATGKPATYCLDLHEGRKCGIPHELGSTGFGVAHAARIAAALLGVSIKGAAIGIHGFGNVGTFTYKFLSEMGGKVVLIADTKGVVHAPDGFDHGKLQEIIDRRGSIAEYPGAPMLPPESFWKVPVDILIPASVTDVINETNKDDIRTRLIVEAGNIPMQEHIEAELFGKGIWFVPDFAANAGGVISSYAEYAGLAAEEMFKLVEEKVSSSVRDVMQRSLAETRNPREVAMELARAKVEAGMLKRKGAF